ncbi:MAG: LamG domain-containing protein [Akkermansiaceae bacterium]
MKKLSPLALAPLALLTSVSSSLADYPSIVNADAPLCYWRFEEDPGATTLADSSGNGLAIDNSAPVGTTVLGEVAAIGNGVRFNGDGYFITPLLLDPSAGDFTIEAVVRRLENTSDVVVVANQDGTLGTGRSNLVVNTATTFTSFAGGATTASGVPVSTDRFDHVILTYDQGAIFGNPTLRFFINGEAAGTSEILPESANGNWVIGANKNLGSQFFNGLVDEIAIYDKRLDDPNDDGDASDSRVSAHFLEFLADTETLINFESDFDYRDSGQSAELTWFVSPALTSLTLDDGTGPVDVLANTTDGNGSRIISPTATTTYTLNGTGPLGTESLEITIVVDEPSVINEFTASNTTIPAGTTTSLSWSVTNGTLVEIDNGLGTVDPISGNIDVNLSEDTTFTLSATNSQGTVTAQVTIEVSAIDDPSLVAHWRVGEAPGETTGTILISETGETFNGVFTGNPTFDTSDPAPVPGGSTASLSFDGVGSWVDIPGFTGIGGSSARTIAFWFKGPAAQNNANANIVGWGTGGTSNRFDTRINTAGSNQIRTEVAGSGSNGTTTLTDDTWHHCAVVFDPNLGTSIGDILFYIDGQLDPLTVTGGTPVNTTTTTPVRIGSSPVFPSRTLTGKMDDIRIFNRALPADEILALIEPVDDTPLEVTAIRRLENGNVELTWSGAPGEYFLEYSVDLSSDSWLELSDSETILPGETNAVSIDDFIAPNPDNTKVFYRFRPAE